MTGVQTCALPICFPVTIALFKNEQLHKAIREVKRKLSEIGRIVEYTSRMKQELSEGEEGLKYWKNTEKQFVQFTCCPNATFERSRFESGFDVLPW